MTAAFSVHAEKKEMRSMRCDLKEDVVCPAGSQRVREDRRGPEHTQTHHRLSPPPLRHIAGFVDSDPPCGRLTLR